MKRPLLLVLLALTAGSASSQQKLPQFQDYPVRRLELYQGEPAPLILTRDDRAFRTRLRQAAKGKPNFAGYYILTVWGCGAGCLMGAAINAKTGRVNWIPHTISGWDLDARALEYRLNSRLIIFSGERNEKKGDNGTHYYWIKGGKFVHIRSILKGKR